MGVRDTESSTKRPPVSSWRVIAAIRDAIASRPKMLTTLVPSVMPAAASATAASCVNGSRAVPSPTQRLP
jgi:hypothetical protein